MKYQFPLNEQESSRLYWELEQRGAFSSGRENSWPYGKLDEEGFFTLTLLQSRYDPRLLSILVDYFRTPRPNINPVSFKESLRASEGLPIACVIGEFVMELCVPVQVKEFFQFLMSGVSPMPTQLFYRGIYSVAGLKMQETLERSLWAFKKWGFLAADPPLLKESLAQTKPYLYDQASRLSILKKWAKDQEKFRLKDYLKEISFSVSRQQGLKDLGSVPGIRKRGKGKGMRYEIFHISPV